MYQRHLENNRQRKVRGLSPQDYDPGPPRPENDGTLLVAPQEVGYLAEELLAPISRLRLAMHDAADDAERYREAADALSKTCRALVEFFDVVGLREAHAHFLEAEAIPLPQLN